MQITIAPNARQIRYFVSCAMNAFDTLPIESAVETARSDLRQLLFYLDALDNGKTLVVGGISAIEGGVRIKSDARDDQALDLVDRYRDPLPEANTPNSAFSNDSDIQDVRLHGRGLAGVGE